MAGRLGHQSGHRPHLPHQAVGKRGRCGDDRQISQTMDAPEWLWWAYGAMVGGYALIKRGIAAIPQVAEINKGKDDVENT